jgi:hypothetical protein
MGCYVLCPLHKLIYHKLLQLLFIHSLALSDARAGGIVVNAKQNVSVGCGLLFHPKGKKPASNGSYRIDGAAFPVEDAGSILLAFHNRQVEDYLAAIIFNFNIASVIVIKSIYDICRLFSRLFGYGCDIFFREINQIGLLPKLLQPLHGNEIIKIEGPLVVAA